MASIEVSDLYHASYLLVHGMSLEEVKTIPVPGTLTCTMRFTGEAVDQLSTEYLSKQAVVNLYSFRQAYNQLNGILLQARRNARKNGKGVIS